MKMKFSTAAVTALTITVALNPTNASADDKFNKLDSTHTRRGLRSLKLEREMIYETTKQEEAATDNGNLDPNEERIDSHVELLKDSKMEPMPKQQRVLDITPDEEPEAKLEKDISETSGIPKTSEQKMVCSDLFNKYLIISKSAFESWLTLQKVVDKQGSDELSEGDMETMESLERMFDEADINNDDQLKCEEVVKMISSDLFNKNVIISKSAFLSWSELQAIVDVLGWDELSEEDKETMESLERMFDEADINNDNQLNCDEFVKMITSN